MIGAIKRRWKSNKKCSDKDKEKVTPILPSCTGPPGLSGGTGPSAAALCINRLRKGPPLPPVDFIHVNSGRIELHPGANGDKELQHQHQPLLWGQHLHYETRHSWCGPQQMGVPDKQQLHQQQQLGTKKDNVALKKLHQSDQNQSHHIVQEAVILQRLNELEKVSKGVPNLGPVVTALKEEVTASVDRQEKLVSDLESLHLRVHTLETNNKALANIILPTLIRLTKEKSSSQTVSSTSTGGSNNSSLKKVGVATSPIKFANSPVTSEQFSNTTTKMKQVPPPQLQSPTKIPAKPGPPNKKHHQKPGSLDLKKPNSTLPPSTKPPFSTSMSTYTTAECRIPFFRPPNHTTSSNSTTHPPKTTVSKSKPKSRLPVRKSSSSSGPSASTGTTPTTTPNTANSSSGIPTFTNISSSPFLVSASTKTKNAKLSSPLIIENKMRFIPDTSKRGPALSGVGGTASTVSSGLPPKDEGYSTMSNGAIDTQIDNQQPVPQPQPLLSSTATFNRPKKLGESSTSSGNTTNGTWTKNKNNSNKKADPTALNLPISPSGRTFATATVLEPASITTTRENVRIVRGLATEIRFSDQSSDDFSGGTVLLEDSDDSDILFLPIEVSSTSGSDSTLVPYPYSRSRSPRSRSTSRSRSRYNTNNSTTDSTSTYYTAQQGGTTTGTDSSDLDAISTSTPTPTPTPTHARKKLWTGGNNNCGLNSSVPWEPVGLEVDEQDLVQRWMRLEDMRNEEEAVVGDEEQLQLWSWDWDGIIHNSGNNTGNNRKDSKRQIQIPSSSETLDLHIPNHSRLSPTKDFEPWVENHKSSPSSSSPRRGRSGQKQSKLPSPIQVDSSTWTKSKRRSFLDSTTPSGVPASSPSPSLTLTTSSSQDGTSSVPPLLASELDFTAEFYRLTSSGTEDKLIQTSTSSSMDGNGDYISGGEEAPADPLQESDLFLQCKNCLEKMSKLISLQQQQDGGGISSSNTKPSLVSVQVPTSPSQRPGITDNKMSISEQFAQLLKMNNSHHHHNHHHAKEGSASKWLPVPRSTFRGASPQGDRNYTLLSSTESEGLVSPSME